MNKTGQNKQTEMTKHLIANVLAGKVLQGQDKQATQEMNPDWKVQTVDKEPHWSAHARTTPG
jgi:hypothetical protein